MRTLRGWRFLMQLRLAGAGNRRPPGGAGTIEVIMRPLANSSQAGTILASAQSQIRQHHPEPSTHALRRLGHRLAGLVALSAMLLLGGCATLTAVRADVTTPKAAPQALVGAKVQLQAAPSIAAAPDADVFQSAVVQAMTHAGMVPLLGQPAPYTARYSFHSYLDFEASFPSAWPPPGAPILLPNGAWIYSGYPLWWSGFSWPPPWYDRVFELEIRDTATGALVYSTSAVTGSYQPRLGPVAQKLADSALAGFPLRSGMHRVMIPGG